MAAAIEVNSTADTTTAGDTGCTLREAITNANANSDTSSGDCEGGTDTDIITFSLGGTITLGSTLPAVTAAGGALTIDGLGQAITISGNNAVRVMEVNGGASLTLQNLTVVNGFSSGSGGGRRGGYATASPSGPSPRAVRSTLQLRTNTFLE